MDAKQDRLQKRLEYLLQEAPAVAAELQGLEQGSGTPHYDQIELQIWQPLKRTIGGAS